MNRPRAITEVAVQFGAADSLVGVMTSPSSVEPGKHRPAFVFLNSGTIHRVGPNRLHATIARELADRGFMSFRMDLSGIGDSPARGGGLSILDRWAAEAQEALDFLMSTYGVGEFVLLGNCSGAIVAFLTAYRDRRIVGAALINLQGPRTYLRYYFKLLFTRAATWRRMLRGSARYRDLLKAALGAVSGVRGREPKDRPTEAIDVDAAIATLAERRARLLMVYCSFDPALDHFNVTLKPKLEKQIARDCLQTEIVSGMDHNFSLLRGQEQLRRTVLGWAERL